MLIRLKLGNAVGCTTKRAHKVLSDVLLHVNRSKTHTETQWWLQQEGDKFCWLPTYKVGREPARHVNSNLISVAFSEVRRRLTAKAPYNAAGDHRYTWQAIKAHDDRLAIYRGRSFSVPKKVWAFAWSGFSCGANHLDLVNVSLQASQPLFRVSVLSKQSGHKTLTLTFRLLTGKLSTGHKEILLQIMDSNHHFEACDSKLVRKENKRGVAEWFFHLTYKDSRDLPKAKFDLESALTVQCNAANQKHGFVAIKPDGSKRYFGPNHVVATECERIDSHRRSMQLRASRGHGRASVYAKQKALTRGKQMLLDRLRKLWISDIVKIVRRDGCSSVHYREPTLGKGLRSHEWFATHGVNWDWTKFETDLKHKLKNESIAYQRTRMSLDEWKQGSERDLVA